MLIVLEIMSLLTSQDRPPFLLQELMFRLLNTLLQNYPNEASEVMSFLTFRDQVNVAQTSRAWLLFHRISFAP